MRPGSQCSVKREQKNPAIGPEAGGTERGKGEKCLGAVSQWLAEELFCGGGGEVLPMSGN